MDATLYANHVLCRDGFCMFSCCCLFFFFFTGLDIFIFHSREKLQVEVKIYSTRTRHFSRRRRKRHLVRNLLLLLLKSDFRTKTVCRWCLARQKCNLFASNFFCIGLGEIFLPFEYSTCLISGASFLSGCLGNFDKWVENWNWLNMNIQNILFANNTDW